MLTVRAEFLLRELLHRRVNQMSGLHALQGRQDVIFLRSGAQTQETTDGERQCGIEIQFLRDVANSQLAVTLDHPFIRGYQPEDGPNKS